MKVLTPSPGDHEIERGQLGPCAIDPLEYCADFGLRALRDGHDWDFVVVEPRLQFDGVFLVLLLKSTERLHVGGGNHPLANLQPKRVRSRRGPRVSTDTVGIFAEVSFTFTSFPFLFLFFSFFIAIRSPPRVR
jgi:hypothetical protein